MKIPSIFAFIALSVASSALADPALLLEDNFDRNELGKGWTVLNGAWELQDGKLHITELKADEHAASGRRVLETTDATFRLRFAMSEGTKAFHLGFDPARGELDKKGHLYSVIVMADQWRIMKHLDKNRPKEDPNEILAQEKHDFQTGRWYDLEVSVRGATVTAKIDSVGELVATHPTFTVKKPTIVLRVSGDTTQVDELQVTGMKKTSQPAN